MKAIEFLPVVCSLLLSSIVAASPPPAMFPDVAATSSNGKYGLKSAGTGTGSWSRISSRDFNISLTDLHNGNILWTRPADRTATPPIGLFVHDTGHAVIAQAVERDNQSQAELVVVDPLGKTTGKVNIQINDVPTEPSFEHDQIRPVDPQKIWNTIANPSPHPHVSNLHYLFSTSIPVSATYRHAPVMSLRKWWGGQDLLMVDLKNAKLLESGARVHTPTIKAEKAETVRLLGECVKFVQATDTEGVAPDTRRAAYWAARLRVHEAVPLLRYLESSERITESTADPRWGGTVTISQGVDVVVTGIIARKKNNDQKASIKPVAKWRRFNGIRGLSDLATIQVSLRRLGEQPKRKSAVVIYSSRNDQPFESPKLEHPKGEGLYRLRRGMRTEEVVSLAGLPDQLLGTWGPSWVYHVDGEWPYSVKLGFRQRTVSPIPRGDGTNLENSDLFVETIEIGPPLWRAP